MDFLDPKETKLRTIRLMIGYTLMTVLIFTATLVMVYQAYGFDVDRKTGEVIQNGLVYIDSAPDGATIYINGQRQSDLTNTRLALREGSYDLSIKRDGYRDWNRKLEVQGGSIERITYPTLIQTNLAEEEIQNFGTDPKLVRTQSPDRSWVLIGQPTNIRVFTELNLKDLDAQTDNPQTRQLTFPQTVFSSLDEGAHTIEIIEWSNDNQHFLVKHTFGQSTEFLMLNRDKPETSFNINKLLSRSPSSIELRDKKFDQWYLYDKQSGNIEFANANREISTVLLRVDEFKSHGKDIILYSQIDKPGEVRIYLWDKGVPKLLRTSTEGKVALDIARYDEKWFAVVASDGDKKTYIYRDPWDILVLPDGLKPAPQAILHASTKIVDVGFSTNTRFILARDGTHIAVYDNELDKMHNYSIGKVLDSGSQVVWMDGHRLLYKTSGKSWIMDFDGANRQELVGSLPTESTFFDRDYTVLYSLQSSRTQAGTIGMTKTDLRYEQDK